MVFVSFCASRSQARTLLRYQARMKIKANNRALDAEYVKSQQRLNTTGSVEQDGETQDAEVRPGCVSHAIV